MSFVGVDPGAKSPAHVLIYNYGYGNHGSHPLNFIGIRAAFVEGQYPRPKSSRQSLMTLSFYAGLAAGSYLERDIPVYVLQPKLWRSSICKANRNGSFPKQVAHNHARRDGLIPDFVWGLGPDFIDAFLIAYAGAKMLEGGAKLTKLNWRK